MARDLTRPPPAALTLEELEDDEQFDISIVARVRTALLPLMEGLPSTVLAAAVDLLQEGSIIYPGALAGLCTFLAGMQVTERRQRAGSPDVDTGADQLVVREKFAAACLSNIFELASTIPSPGALSKGSIAFIVEASNNGRRIG